MHSNRSSPRSLELHCRRPSKTRVLIAAPYPVVRMGLRALLENLEDIVVVAEASSGAEVLPLVEVQKPDVLIIDVELPELSGTAIIKQLKAMQPPMQVLGFGAASAPYLCDLLQSGAAGYLSMDETPEIIVAAVRGIACGEGEWLSRQAAAQLIRTLANRVETCNQITARQREVLALVAAGHTNRHIGQALGISEKTVEKHLGQLMVKMAVASRVEMAVQAVQKGWVSFAVPSVPEPAALSI